MNYSKTITKTLLSILITGIITTPLTLLSPSEDESIFWMGVSKGRLAIFAVQVLAIFVISAILFLGTKRQYNSALFQNISRFLNKSDYYTTLRYLFAGTAIFLSFSFVFFSISIPQALSAISAWLAFSAWVIYTQFVKNIPAPQDFIRVKITTPFPSIKKASKSQKWTASILLGVGLLYFCLYIPLNLKGSGSMNELNLDEMVMYPVIVKMLSAQPTIRMSLYHFINYGAYIYGFPFFGWSAILLLPLKLVFGQGYADHLQINMLLLRQLINVLPAILACFIFTYLATRFKKFWLSLLLFVLILTLPGMTGLNNTFWHPDGINLLFISLAFYFLDRDQLQFGANFYFAAIAIGFSVATRLFGLFFVLAIALLLITGLIKKILSLRKTIVTGMLFFVLMVATIWIANPYLFSPGEPKTAIHSFSQQSKNITQGWDEPDPEGIYQTGFKAWWPFITRDYGSSLTLIFLGVSTIIGIIGVNRKVFYQTLFAWLIVIGTYLIGFVMVKSPWYLLPLLYPLYSTAMAIPDNMGGMLEKLKITPSRAKLTSNVITGLISLILLLQIMQNLKILVPVFLAA